MNTAYVLLRTGYADWEAASALAELRRTFGFSVKTIGLTSEPVGSMGGLKVMPDLPLSALADNVAARSGFREGNDNERSLVRRNADVYRNLVKK